MQCVSIGRAFFFLLGMCCLSGCGSRNRVIVKEDSKKVLSVLAGQSTSDAGIEDMIDEMLAEKFPKVQLEWECVDWGEKFDSQMQARFAAGDIPDIMIGKAQDVYAYAQGGYLAPLEQTLEDRIVPQALRAVMVDEEIYGLPYNAIYQGVLYNQDIFEQYHIEPPETIEDMKSIVNLLEKDGVMPFAAHFQEDWKIGNMTMQFLMNGIFLNIPDWGDRFRRGEESFADNSVIIDCLSQNQYILDHAWKDAIMIDQYESDKRFAEGEAAMYMTGSWSLQSMNQYGSQDKYGIFPYPNQNGDSKLIRETNMTFMKSTTSEHEELIDQILLELLQNEELMQEILDFTQTYSVAQGVETGYHSVIEDDIRDYEEQGRVVEVTLGNNQLIWAFQNDLAAKQAEWLRGKMTLEDVTKYADTKRAESSWTISK